MAKRLGSAKPPDPRNLPELLSYHPWDLYFYQKKNDDFWVPVMVDVELRCKVQHHV